MEAATALLRDVMTFEHPADRVIGQFFRANPKFGQRDRSLLADIIYDVLRHRRRLETLCETSNPRQLLLAALVKLQGVSLAGMEGVARRPELDWLTTVRAADASNLSPAQRLDLPDWMYERLCAQYTADSVEAIGRALQRAAPLDLRVNTLKTTREAVLARLEELGVSGQPTPYSPTGIRIVGKPAIQQFDLFKSGEIEVQDEGSQLIAQLLAPRRQDMVVDFCAGAGGKTLALGALMASQGRLYAFDVSDKRLSNLRPRLKRSGLSNVFPQRIAGVRDSHVKRLAGKVERVLLDVPCSGLGTLRRNPDLKWRTAEADIAQMITKQTEIIASASFLLKPGGRMVYATCSLLREENEAIVEDFLSRNPGFTLADSAQCLASARIELDTGTFLQLRPDLHGTDGFFAAVLTRNT